MVDYAGLQATAARLIKAYGVPVSLLKQGASADYDPASGTIDQALPGAYSANAVRVGTATEFQYTTREATDTRTSESTRTLLLSVVDPTVAPVLGDLISMDGAQWRIYGLTTVAPGAVALMYQIGVSLI